MKSLVFLLFAAGSLLGVETNRPPARPGLEITATFGEFHLKDNTAYYSNNVVVVDPPAKPTDPPTIMKCHELTARRNANGKIDNIVALGSVQMDQGDNHARGHRAVYTGTNEIMVLTGAFDPADTNRPLPQLYSSQGTNYGTRIIYDRLNDKLRIEEVKTIIPSSTLSTADRAKTNAVPSTNKLFSLPVPAQLPK